MIDLINVLTQNGIGVVCVAYLIYFQSTTMKNMNDILSKMQMALESISDRLENLESKLK
jgi:formate/nitrite transporter FocA (FNT family)